jgi:hypothetical protein
VSASLRQQAGLKTIAISVDLHPERLYQQLPQFTWLTIWEGSHAHLPYFWHPCSDARPKREMQPTQKFCPSISTGKVRLATLTAKNFAKAPQSRARQSTLQIRSISPNKPLPQRREKMQTGFLCPVGAYRNFLCVSAALFCAGLAK